VDGEIADLTAVTFSGTALIDRALLRVVVLVFAAVALVTFGRLVFT
jgi:hypothetical protein